MTFERTGNPKNKQILLRLTPADKAQIEAEAHQAHLSVSEFVQRKALSRKVTPQSDLHLINELRLGIVALREIYWSGTPVNDERLKPALDAITAAMTTVIDRKKRGV